MAEYLQSSGNKFGESENDGTLNACGVQVDFRHEQTARLRCGMLQVVDDSTKNSGRCAIGRGEG